ncbi:hypothetical protein D3C78_1331800 [compost metagenome]
MQLVNNPTLRYALGRPGFSEQYVKQLELLDYMTLQKNSSDTIQDIVFYESLSDTVLSNSYGKSTLEHSPQTINIDPVMKYGLGLFAELQAGWLYFLCPPAPRIEKRCAAGRTLVSGEGQRYRRFGVPVTLGRALGITDRAGFGSHHPSALIRLVSARTKSG